MEPRNLGGYLLLQELAVSRTGRIFKAKHGTLGRVVALKVLSSQAAASGQLVERFRRKAKLLARMDDPRFVKTLEEDQREGVHYLVMEYVEGQDLWTSLKQRGPLPVEQAVHYVREAAAGLAYLHAQGACHRNVKPSNLLVDAQGNVKIVGLGLARLEAGELLSAETLGADLTSAGQVMGTYEYMAPEQAADSSCVDPRVDIYSLGCTLFALLTGRWPYAGKSSAEQIVAHRRSPIPSLRAARAEVPEALDAVFQKMVAKRPEDRYRSMDEAAAALRACMEPQQAVAVPEPERPPAAERSASYVIPTTPAASLQAGPQTPPPVPPPVLPQAKQPLAEVTGWGILLSLSRRNGMLINVALFCIAATLLTVLLVWSEQRSTRPTAPEKPAAEMPTAKAALTLDWPEAEREGATLRVDGKRLPVADIGPLRYEIEPGRHELVVTRRGHGPYRETVRLPAGEALTVTPVWQAATAPSSPPPAPGQNPPKAPKAPSQGEGVTDVSPVSGRTTGKMPVPPGTPDRKRDAPAVESPGKGRAGSFVLPAEPYQHDVSPSDDVAKPQVSHQRASRRTRSHPTLAANLVVNGGFETADAAGRPMGWTGAKRASTVAAEPYEGNRCLQMLPEPNSAMRSQPISLNRRTSVRASARVRVEGINPDAQLVLIVLLRRANETEPLARIANDQGRQAMEAIDQGWVELRCGGPVPNGADTLSVSLEVWNLRTGVVYWDDVSATLEGARQFLPLALLRFDFETPQSETFPGFTKVTADDRYDKARGYGWIVEQGAKLEAVERISDHAHVRKPDSLTNDFCYADKARFRIDLPPGRYKVWMILGDIGGWWENPGRDWRRGHAVDLGGECVAQRSGFGSAEEYREKWFFKDYFTQHRKGEDLWDRYVEPMFRQYLFEALVERGRGLTGSLELEFRNAPLCAMVIFPPKVVARVEDEIQALNAARKQAFPVKEIPYVRRQPSAHLTAQEQARGYVLYARHYMNEIVPDTLPPREQIGRQLQAFLSRNEYEPVTFGLYAARELKGVQVALSELEGPGKNKILGSEIEIRMARLAPITCADQYRIMPHVLQPFDKVDVAPDASMWFWITVHAGKSQAPGIYQGQVIVTPASAEPARLDVAVTLLPITLKDTTATVLNNAIHTMGIGRPDQVESQKETYALLRRNNATQVYFDDYELAVPGTYEGGQWKNLSFQALDASMQSLKRMGVPLPFLIFSHQSRYVSEYLKKVVGNPPGELTAAAELAKATPFAAELAKPRPFDHPYYEAQLQLCQALDRHMAEHPDLYPSKVYWVPAISAISDGMPFETIQKLCEITIKRGQVRAVYNQNIYTPVIERLLAADFKQLLCGSSRVTREMAARAHQKGIPIGYSNAGGVAVGGRLVKGERNLISYYRLFYGFFLWLSKVDLVLEESPGGVGSKLPYNPFDSAQYEGGENELWRKVRLSPDGPLPLVCYEVCREGADDLRYAELMMELAEKAAAVPGEKARTAAAQARAFQTNMEQRIPPSLVDPARKEDLKWEYRRFDPYRWEMARMILSLQESLESSAGPR